MIMLAAAILVVLTLFPFIFLFYLSFCNWDTATARPVFSGIANYAWLIHPSSGFFLSLGKSLIFTGIAVFLEFSLGLLLALLLEKGSRLIGLARNLLLLPMVMTPVVAGLTWRILYDPTFVPDQ